MPSMKEILAASGVATYGEEAKPAIRPVVHAINVPNTVVPNAESVPNAKSPRKKGERVAEAVRVSAWKKANAEKYKESQRLLMKKRRAEKRAKTASGVPA